MSDHKRKLIEVALPVEDISAAAKADKAVKTGTLRNVHKWFAPMPLPAWRGLLFAALVDDPADSERRAYLLDVVKRLVSDSPALPPKGTLAEAKAILVRQYPNGLPLILDPFCGAGSTLVEAQRLGLPTQGSDLNPVPVLIARTLADLLPKAAYRQPISAAKSDADGSLFGPSPERHAAEGPFEGVTLDVRHYAAWVEDKVRDSLTDCFVERPDESPIAWIWARTAVCTNPRCGAEVVLTTSWWLSKKPGDLAWIEPQHSEEGLLLEVVAGRSSGNAPPPPKVGRGAAFVCITCGSVLPDSEISRQGLASGLGLRMLAVVAERAGRRVYREPTADEIAAANSAPDVEDFPHVPFPDNPRWFSGPRYGLKSQADLYTRRQLATLAAFSDAVADVYAKLIEDGADSEYAKTITTLLSLNVGKLAQYGSTQAFLYTRLGPSAAKAAFGRNDVPMTWDFVETASLGRSIGGWMTLLDNLIRSMPFVVPEGIGSVIKADARTVQPCSGSMPVLVATDPPYFDAIGYADLSDYFYLWHRRALRKVHPDLYATVAAPKSGELTAVPSHHEGSATAAQTYFTRGFTETFRNLAQHCGDDLPMLVVYASKEKAGGVGEESRWSSILTAITDAGLEITGTWPIHGTTTARMISAGTNALASYVVMVCRPRAVAAGSCSLADFNRALRRDLQPAVHDLQAAGILPVDLAQAAMGPGMQAYSRYEQVIDQSGKRVPVEQALRLINAALGEVLDEQEGELDPQSRFAVTWWERHGWAAASFGEADKVARPQGISVDEAKRAGVVGFPIPGFVAVLGSGELDRSWKPGDDRHATAWEAVHHLADRLIDGGGAIEAGRLLAEIGTLRDPTQALVYRLHDIAAKKGRTKDQERYNALIGSWSDLIALSASEKDGLF